mmetsp:Transcript_22420/g.45348  ORF Transcript_22420/g.45348 Transcript_22420/m.45348 type:complete len:130 (+) Transcript_22420:1765-2154(+)
MELGSGAAADGVGGEASPAPSQQEEAGVEEPIPVVPRPLTAEEVVQVSSLAPGLVQEVLKSKGFIQSMLRKRPQGPYRAEWSGGSKCHLCHRTFQVGHAMVKAFLPEQRWVHVECADAVLKHHGRPLQW